MRLYVISLIFFVWIGLPNDIFIFCNLKESSPRHVFIDGEHQGLVWTGQGELRWTDPNRALWKWENEILYFEIPGGAEQFWIYLFGDTVISDINDKLDYYESKDFAILENPFTGLGFAYHSKIDQEIIFYGPGGDRLFSRPIQAGGGFLLWDSWYASGLYLFRLSITGETGKIVRLK